MEQQQFIVLKAKIRCYYRNLKKNINNLFSRSYYKIVLILNIIAMINFYSVANIKAMLFQLLVFCFGTIIAIILTNINYENIKKLSIPFYMFVCILIGFVYAFGIKVNGAKRWLRLFGFTLQPTELFKIALIMAIAFYLQSRVKPDTRSGRQYNIVDLLIPLTLILLPTTLILIQPDLGTAIICLIITASILFFMGIEKKTLILIILIIFSGAGIGWKHLKPYQRDRIDTFFNPTLDLKNKNWQSHQSIIIFGSGGLFGKGIKKGPGNQLGYLPEAQTDFALTSLAEEHGFVSIVVVLSLINFMIMKFLIIAKNSRDKFSTVVSVGVSFWLFSQSFINTSMIIGILPVVGIQFPIISYGGSGLLSIMIAIGIMANIEQHKNRR